MAEQELSFEKVLEIATATEMASKNLIDLGGKMHNDDNKVNKVDEEAKSPNLQSKWEWYHCGGNHDPSGCKFKDEACYKCQKKGHIAKVCRGKKKPPKQDKRRHRLEGKQRMHFVEERADQDDIYAMYHLSSEWKKSFKVDLQLCGRKNMMEIDIGASKTILNEATYGRFGDALGPLQKSKAVLSMNTGGIKIPVLGAVSYGSCKIWKSAARIGSPNCQR